MIILFLPKPRVHKPCTASVPWTPSRCVVALAHVIAIFLALPERTSSKGNFLLINQTSGPGIHIMLELVIFYGTASARTSREIRASGCPNLYSVSPCAPASRIHPADTAPQLHPRESSLAPPPPPTRMHTASSCSR